jgi:hypothetical protein
VGQDSSLYRPPSAEDDAGSKVSDAARAREGDARPALLIADHPLVRELETLDVNSLSPLDALNLLAEWKKRLAQDG